MKGILAVTSVVLCTLAPACGGSTDTGQGHAGAGGHMEKGGDQGTGNTTSAGGNQGTGNTTSTGGNAGADGTGIPCTTSKECPQIKAPCKLCDDGSSACPWSRCEQGFCQSGFDACPPASPCSGKACGDVCTTCSPDQSCPPIVEYCDAQLKCQRTAPTCDACSATGQSCAKGETCCAGLECCVGVPVPAGSEYCSTVCPKSDQNIKRDFLSVDPNQVLEKLASLPVGTWAYRTESSSERHIGPMAQDFMAAFHVGSSDRTILQVDADGVAFAAIQALNSRLKAVEEQNQRLQRQLEDQQTRCAH